MALTKVLLLKRVFRAVDLMSFGNRLRRMAITFAKIARWEYGFFSGFILWLIILPLEVLPPILVAVLFPQIGLLLVVLLLDIPLGLYVTSKAADLLEMHELL